jgi:hypothetical protein
MKELTEIRDPNFTYDVDHILSGKVLERPDATQYKVIGYMASEGCNFFYCKLLATGSNEYSYVMESLGEAFRNSSAYDVEYLDTYEPSWFEKFVQENKTPIIAHPKKTCTCGAKHTNNPEFHLNYCDLK